MGKRTISRRRFLEGSGTALTVAGRRAGASRAAPGGAVRPADTSITLTVNGTARRLEVEDRWTLVEALRDHAGLTGTKIGCDRGECGACTVAPRRQAGLLVQPPRGLGRRPVRRRPIEGLLNDPLQQAFIDHDAPQCGFCTSGQLDERDGAAQRESRIRPPTQARAR